MNHTELGVVTHKFDMPACSPAVVMLYNALNLQLYGPEILFEIYMDLNNI